MSLIQIKIVVEKFIESARNDFLLVKGGWGVGKTYFWQETIADLSAKGKVGKESYSYVSLFGIDSLEGLKNSIVASKISASAIARSENTSFSQSLAAFKETFKDFENIPFLRNYTGGMVGSLAFRIVENTLICFDDLERKSNRLDIKEILGLASFLKEQRNCKIVFISNDGTLSEGDIKEFTRHSEKLVDIELRFAPTPDEVFNLVFTESDPHYSLIRRCCLQLGISNIRILKRVRRFIDDLLLHLKDIEEPVVNGIIETIILFVWCYYDKDSNAPSLDFVEDFSFVNLTIKRDINKKPITKEDERLHALLTGYGHLRTDEIDRELRKFVEKGYLNEDKFFVELGKKNTQAVAQRGNEEFSRVWELFQNSFADNEEFFVEEVTRLFDSNIEYLILSDIDSVIKVLRDLGRDTEAEYIVDKYCDIHKDKFNVEFRRTIDYGHINDKNLRRKIDQISVVHRKEFDLATIMEHLASDSGYSFDEIAYLASLDHEKYYSFFKSLGSRELYWSVKNCLRLDDISDASGYYKQVASKTTDALRRIATESRINKVRIWHVFGIKLDEENGRGAADKPQQ